MFIAEQVPYLLSDVERQAYEFHKFFASIVQDKLAIEGVTEVLIPRVIFRFPVPQTCTRSGCLVR